MAFSFSLMTEWKPLRIGDGMGLKLVSSFPLSPATAYYLSLRKRCWDVGGDSAGLVIALLEMSSDRLILGDSHPFPLSLRFFRSVDENFFEWVLMDSCESSEEDEGLECE